MSRAPGLYERNVQYGINVFCIVPFQELNNFLLDYSCEVVFSDFSDKPAKNASGIACFAFFDAAQFSEPLVCVE